MKLGISCFSLNAHQKDGTMTILDIVDWAAQHNCEHLELVPFDMPFLLEDGTINTELVTQIKARADYWHLELSSLSLGTCVLKDTKEEVRAEMERFKKYMHICTMLGIKRMRCDTCAGRHPLGYNTPQQFEKDFPRLVAAIQELADYATSLGLNTTLENHGLYVNGADRIIRVIEAANRPNLGLTMDVANFRSVDEICDVSVEKCISYAEVIHLKDFYIRPVEQMITEDPACCYHDHWFSTCSGKTLLRGSILGQGDLDIWNILKIIKRSGYDKYISIEFEGLEECCSATESCLKTARYMWDHI